ncbi:hypothetical protein DW352_18235 [Pseudolabrys taiwanensis]|uniref:Quinol:cytochrome C oxidoreductase n=1 Tax=Pseudolabrys taiwanensis TaxID=331696 RepID=A0A345ZZE3_9HYPH|nr:hypothetical protein [Pseudolabrys taiwanensis]AXK82290.1 hypothetical protein DW352_18235 [Pseudolabrys taiwanensis]
MMSVDRRLIIAGILGLAGCVVAAWLDVHALMLGWLCVAATLSGIAVGAMAVLMLTYLVRGPWTEGLHAPLVATSMTIPAVAVLFVPVLVGVPWLYPWVGKGVVDPGSFKAIYLTPWFFIARTVFYFGVWTVLSWWTRAAWGSPRRMVASAAAGLIIYALTASFAGIDWLETLTPEFHSSLYGLLVLTFQLLAGYAFVLVIGLSRRRAETDSYGATLLAVLLLWAYNHAMQYIIVWSGNLPRETVWYEAREHGVWGAVLWTLIFLQFILPFFALLTGKVRNARRPLLVIASATVGLRLVEACVLALPETAGGRAVILLAVPASLLLAGALWLGAFAGLYRRVLVSAHDRQTLENDFDAAGSPLPSSRP